MTRSLLLPALLLLATAAPAQTFRPASGPWTRAHELVGSTPDGRIFARVGPRLGVTRDGGHTWTVVSETTAPTRIAGSGSAIYGAFPNGVRLSTDGGATWTPFGLDGQAILDVTVSETVYALTSTAVYRLGDLAVWQPTARPGMAQGTRLLHLDAAGGTVGVAGYDSVCGGSFAQAVFFRSRDIGATWTRTSGTGSGWDSDVAVGPDGTAYFSTTDSEGCLNMPSPGGLFAQASSAAAATLRSGGDTGGVAIGADGQVIVSPGVPEGNVAGGFRGVEAAGGSVLAVSAGAVACGFDPPCFGVRGSGLFASRGAQSVSTGFAGSPITALAVVRGELSVAADGAVYAPVGDRWRVTTPLGGVTGIARVPWTATRYVAVSVVQGFVLPAILWAGEPFRRDDLFPSASGGASDAVDVGGALLLSSNGFYGQPGVNRYTEAGSSPVLAACQVTSLGVVGPVTVYAGSAGDPNACGSQSGSRARAHRSDDAGLTWAPDDAGLTARDVYAFTSAGPVHLAGTSGGVFARTPGAPWQMDGLAGRTVFTFYDAPDGLLAGTDDGLFRRDAAGAWSRYGTGLDGRTVYAVLATTDAFGAWTGVGTDAGLFQTRAFGVTAETAPASAALSVRTVPNPARGVRTVRVAGTAGEPVAVVVFDALGRVVADLGPVTAGDVLWDASGLPPGVYVVRATTGSGASSSVRAVVLR